VKKQLTEKSAEKATLQQQISSIEATMTQLKVSIFILSVVLVPCASLGLAAEKTLQSVASRRP
jgi:prefoldin subunit 5